MKMLQIIYNLAPGGAQRLVVDLSNEFSKRGHLVTLCVLRDDSQSNFDFYKCELSEKVEYLSLKIPVGFKLNNILKLFKLIRRVKPQVVTCHQNLVNYVFPLTIIFPGIIFFENIHTDASKIAGSKIEYWIRWVFYRTRKMKAVTISPETSRSLEANFGISPFGEISNGRATPEPSALYSEVKNEIHNYKDRGCTVFVHIGSCSEAKNQIMLVNVFNKLIQSGEQVVLLIIGPGFDSKEGQNLKNSAGKNIFFLDEKHNISDYLLNADAFCLSSIYEGMPISLIEALACGCVPICTPIGGMVNVISNGVTGYLSETVSENDYYNSVLTYLTNKTQVKKEDLVKYYFSHYSIEACADKYLTLYNK
jgi:glycosyltransferase involved in cell wall biosynthesis